MRSKAFSLQSITRNEFYLGSTITTICVIMHPIQSLIYPVDIGASIGIGQSTRLHICSNIALKSKD